MKNKIIKNKKMTFNQLIRELIPLIDNDGVIKNLIITDCIIKNIPKEIVMFRVVVNKNWFLKYFIKPKTFFLGYEIEECTFIRNYFMGVGYKNIKTRSYLNKL